MKKIILLLGFIVCMVNIVSPVAYAQEDDGENQYFGDGRGQAITPPAEEQRTGLSDLDGPVNTGTGGAVQKQTPVSTNPNSVAPTDFTNGIVVCGRHTTTTDPGKTTTELAVINAQECNFQALIVFINRLVNYIIIIATLLMVFQIAYTGWEYLNAGGEPGKLTKLKERLTNIVIGIVILLGSWLLFRTFVDSKILTEGYKAYIYLAQ